MSFSRLHRGWFSRAAFIATSALIISMLSALPAAHAAITAPAHHAVVSGVVTITESGGKNSCTLGSDKASSRLQVTRVSDDVVVHSASRNKKGSLSTAWDSIGQPNGQYRIDSWTTDASGFLCAAKPEKKQPTSYFVVENHAAVALTAPATVTTGEAFAVEVATTVNDTSTAAADSEVTITVDQLGSRTVTTDSTGHASATFATPAPAYLPADTSLSIDAEVADTAYLVGGTTTGSISLTPRTSGMIYNGDTRAQPDTRATLSATLVDLTEGSSTFGAPIADKEVTLNLDDVDKTSTTTVNGQVAKKFDVAGNSRIIPAGASFAGDDIWLPSADVVNFFVGEAAAQTAPTEHSTAGGVTRAVGSIFGWMLSPFTQAAEAVVDVFAHAYDQVVGTLLGTAGVDIDSLEHAHLLHLLNPAQLKLLLSEGLGAVNTSLATSGDYIDAGFNALVDRLTANTPLAELADTARYQWRSVYVASDGTQQAREFGAIMEVPSLLDVTGDGVPDVMASVLIGLDLVPKLQVIKLPGTPTDLPLSLQAVLQLPGNADTYRFGYDTRASNAPQKFEADIILGDEGATLAVAADSDESLAVTAAITPAGVSGDDATLAPEEMRLGITFDPAPVQGAIALALPDGGTPAQDISAFLSTDQPTLVEIDLAQDSGSDELFVAHGLIDRVDGNLELALTGSDSGALGVGVHSDNGLDAIEITALELDAGRTVSDIRLAMTDVPDVVEFALDADGQGTMNASAPIGIFEAGFASGTKIMTLPDDSYIRVEQTDDYNSVALRLVEFEALSLEVADTVSLGLTAAPGPLRIIANMAEISLSGTIEDAPHHLNVGLDTNGDIQISGSDAIDQIHLRGHKADGIAMGATDVELTLTDVPSIIRVSMGEDGAVFDTGNEPIGQLELLVGSGDLEPLPGEDDGLVIDQGGPDGMALAARISGLRQIGATLSGNLEILLDTVASKIFEITMIERDNDGNVDREVSATIDHLVPNLQLGLVDDGSGAMRLTYRADEATNGLHLNMGGLEGSIAAPLPASLDVCMDDDTACLPHLEGLPEDPALGSISFRASEHTTLNLADPSQGMEIDNLRIQVLELSGDLNVDDGGPLYLNTSLAEPTCADPVGNWCEAPVQGGSITVDQGSAMIVFTPGVGFSAIDAITDLEVTRTLGQPSGAKGKSGTGRITCVAGTSLKVSVRVIGLPITLDLKGAICNEPEDGRDDSNLGIDSGDNDSNEPGEPGEPGMAG